MKKAPTKKKTWKIKCDNCNHIVRLNFQGACPKCGCALGTYVRS